MADLESREVLLAKVAGGLQGVLQQAVSLFAAPLSQAARTLAALETAAAENPSLLAAGPAGAEETQAPSDQEPTNEELAVAAAPEPTTDSPAAEAAPAAAATEAAPADSTDAAPAADSPQAAPAAEDN